MRADVFPAAPRHRRSSSMEVQVELLWIPRTSLKIGVKRPPRRRPRGEELQIDQQTFRDLEIFESEEGEPSLFELLDRTRTTGGSKVLETRMRRPWAKLEKIEAVQQSLRHILDHRAGFNILPADGIVTGVEHYLYSGLPVVTAPAALGAWIEAFGIRIAELGVYRRIVRGVRRTGQMVHALRRLASRPELSDAPGDLGACLHEVRQLADRTALAPLPADGHGELPFWRVMRIDRMIRMDERTTIERLMRLVFELDALVSMADAMAEYGFVLPQGHEGATEMVGEGVFHPFVKNPVPNSLRVNQQHRLVFVTGPNMAGKTTYLRACGTAVYLAHLGMGAPARSFRFSPCDSLFSAITLADSVREGISFFQAEALRLKTIAHAIADGRHVVALLDEPFMGTNVKDALDASGAVLARLAGMNGSVFLVSSHLIELGDALVDTGAVHCSRFEAAERGGHLAFDYVLRPGLSTQRLGVRVLQEQGVFDLLDQAAEQTS